MAVFRFNVATLDLESSALITVSTSTTMKARAWQVEAARRGKEGVAGETKRRSQRGGGGSHIPHSCNLKIRTSLQIDILQFTISEYNSVYTLFMWEARWPHG